MGIFGRRKITVPDWASLFTGKQYTAFIAALDGYFQETYNLSYEIDDGVLMPEANGYGFKNLGLHNVAHLCKQNRIGDYPTIVTYHFDLLIQASEFEKEFKKIEKGFEQVKQYVAVRLYSSDYIASIGGECVMSRGFAGELNAVLVFDFPHTVANIKPEQIAPWGKTSDELFALGLANVRKNYETPIEKMKFGPKGSTIFACEAEHLFVTNVLFDLDMHHGLIGKGGSLIAAPHRNLALIYPINGVEVVQIINRLCATVPGLYGDNPGSLTKEIYWFQNGKFTPLPYDFVKGRISFFPPEEFVELLNSLV